MRYALLLTISILAALVEATSLALPLTLLLIVLMAIQRDDQLPLVFGFLAGVMVDFFSVGTIGQTSLIFLLIVTAIMVYKRKFQSGNILFVFFAIFLSLIFFLAITNQFSFNQVLSKILLPTMVALLIYEIWTKLS